MLYIDKEFRCHVSNPNGEFREIDKDIFRGKCTEYIEGRRYIPPGESWTRDDGQVFQGEMISPWKDSKELDDAQSEYEREMLAEYEELINELYEEVTAE